MHRSFTKNNKEKIIKVFCIILFFNDSNTTTKEYSYWAENSWIIKRLRNFRMLKVNKKGRMLFNYDFLHLNAICMHCFLLFLICEFSQDFSFLIFSGRPWRPTSYLQPFGSKTTASWPFLPRLLLSSPLLAALTLLPVFPQQLLFWLSATLFLPSPPTTFLLWRFYCCCCCLLLCCR